MYHPFWNALTENQLFLNNLQNDLQYGLLKKYKFCSTTIYFCIRNQAYSSRLSMQDVVFQCVCLHTYIYIHTNTCSFPQCFVHNLQHPLPLDKHKDSCALVCLVLIHLAPRIIAHFSKHWWVSVTSAPCWLKRSKIFDSTDVHTGN